MTQVTFFPVGRADTALIELSDGRRMLVDYAEHAYGRRRDKRCDLPALLEADLKAAGRDGYAVVAFTHLDDDHTTGASEFFHLEHAAVYQAAGRHKIETLWVPAAAITEENLKDPDAKVIRAEARHRLKEGKGIKVFSRPERLKDWFEKNKISMEDRRGCFVDAGKLVGRLHAGRRRRRVLRALAARQADRRAGRRGPQRRQPGVPGPLLRRRHDDGLPLRADVNHEVLAEIVDITRHYGNDDRLHWNVYKLPHHCSYTAIGPEKGGTRRRRPIRSSGSARRRASAWATSSRRARRSRKGTTEDDDVQPPHRQAAEYYRQDVLALRGNLARDDVPPDRVGRRSRS